MSTTEVETRGEDVETRGEGEVETHPADDVEVTCYDRVFVGCFLAVSFSASCWSTVVFGRRGEKRTQKDGRGVVDVNVLYIVCTNVCVLFTLL